MTIISISFWIGFKLLITWCQIWTSSARNHSTPYSPNSQIKSTNQSNNKLPTHAKSISLNYILKCTTNAHKNHLNHRTCSTTTNIYSWDTSTIQPESTLMKTLSNSSITITNLTSSSCISSSKECSNIWYLFLDVGSILSSFEGFGMSLGYWFESIL